MTPPAVVIPVREAREHETLRYTLRSWAAAGAERVVLIGGRPSWYRGEHHRTTQRVGVRHQWLTNLAAAFTVATRMSDDLIWWSNDDILPLAPVTELPTFARSIGWAEYLTEWADRPQGTYSRLFVDGMRSQLAVLQSWGWEGDDITDTHMPHPMNPHLLGEVMARVVRDHPRHPLGQMRGIYGALHPHGGIVRVRDPKIMSHAAVDTDLGWVSTCSASWRSRAGLWIRRHYQTPSPWEA